MDLDDTYYEELARNIPAATFDTITNSLFSVRINKSKLRMIVGKDVDYSALIQQAKTLAEEEPDKLEVQLLLQLSSIVALQAQEIKDLKAQIYSKTQNATNEQITFNPREVKSLILESFDANEPDRKFDVGKEIAQLGVLQNLHGCNMLVVIHPLVYNLMRKLYSGRSHLYTYNERMVSAKKFTMVPNFVADKIAEAISMGFENSALQSLDIRIEVGKQMSSYFHNARRSGSRRAHKTVNSDRSEISRPVSGDGHESS